MHSGKDGNKKALAWALKNLRNIREQIRDKRWGYHYCDEAAGLRGAA